MDDNDKQMTLPGMEDSDELTETIDRLQPSETSAKAGDLAQLLKDMAQ